MTAEKKLYKRLKFIHQINHFLFNRFRFFGSRKLGRKIASTFLPELNSKKVLCPTVLGFDMILNKNGGKSVYNLGFYEMGTLNVMKHCLQKDSIFIDAGASIGLMSIYAARIVGNGGKVLSFEPQKERYTILSENIKINQLSNIKAFNCGLGTEESEMKLYTDRNSPSLVDPRNEKEFETVKIRKLDNILKEESIENVRFLKADVEGFEIMVLQGAESIIASENAPVLCLEYFKRNQKKSGSAISLLEYLKKINQYHFFQVQKSSDIASPLVEIKTNADIRDEDNLYCLLDSHINELKGTLI